MTFSFGNSKSSSTFGTSATTGSTSLFGGATSTNTFGKSASTGGTGLFGQSGTTSSAPSLFGNTTATTSATAGGSLFGNTTTASTNNTSLFSNNTGGTSLFGNTSSNTGTTGGLFGNSNTGGGGLFGASSTTNNTNQNTQNAGQNAPQNQLLYTARALSQPGVFNDERDGILAKFNLTLASWGCGKAYLTVGQQQDAIELTPSNHFCRFKTVGYSLLPTAKDKDGLVCLVVKKSIGDNGLKKGAVVDTLHQVFGKNPNVTVSVTGMKKIDEAKSEITIFVKEQKADGTSRKVPASELATGLNQQNVKSQLASSIGLEDVVVRTSLSSEQIKAILDAPPACIDPVIWKQAIQMNPEEKKMIPVPMLGFSALHQRLKKQEEMSEGHQNRSELLQREIRTLQEKQANTRAKIEERKRNLLELSHRILEVTIQQEIQRKAGLAIQTEEEQLRAQLEALNNQLRAPTQFRGRLNELLSSIRMQGEIRQHSSSGSMSLDEGAIQDVKKHLQEQQAGLNHMIEKMKTAFGDLQTIENGLIETENRRI